MYLFGKGGRTSQGECDGLWSWGRILHRCAQQHKWHRLVPRPQLTTQVLVILYYLIIRSFTLLNNCRDTSLYAKAGSPSILFLTAFTGDGDDGRFLTRDEASSVAGWDDLKQKRTFLFAFFFKTDFQSFSNLTGITINNDIEVDHRMDPDQDDGGASTATIVLAVLLALVILAGVAVLLFVQRGWVSSFRLQCCQYCCFRLECCFFFYNFFF